MNCNEFWEKADEGTLSPQLQEHLQSCPSCMEEFPVEMWLRKNTESTETNEIHKAPDSLWNRIEQELDRESAFSTPKTPVANKTFLNDFFHWLTFKTEFFKTNFFKPKFFKPELFKPVLVVSLALLIIFSGSLYFNVEQEADLQSQAESTFSDTELTDSALRELQKAELEYIEAIAKFTTIVESKTSLQSEPLYRLYNEKLVLLDNIIAECQEALQGNELNINVREYLLLAYKEKVETLDAISKLS